MSFANHYKSIGGVNSAAAGAFLTSLTAIQMSHSLIGSEKNAHMG
jgi:hypothetical protein